MSKACWECRFPARSGGRTGRLACTGPVVSRSTLLMWTSDSSSSCPPIESHLARHDGELR